MVTEFLTSCFKKRLLKRVYLSLHLVSKSLWATNTAGWKQWCRIIISRRWPDGSRSFCRGSSFLFTRWETRGFLKGSCCCWHLPVKSIFVTSFTANLGWRSVGATVTKEGWFQGVVSRSSWCIVSILGEWCCYSLLWRRGIRRWRRCATTGRSDRRFGTAFAL